MSLDGDRVSFLTGYPVDAPPLNRPIIFDQVWRDVTFVHWPVERDSIVHLFPPGIRPDVFEDGLTYVALVPFVMRGLRLGPAPSPRIPWLGSFLETNIRLYSVDDAGRHGALFRSLETERLLVVAAARSGFGIPYTWARLTLNRDDDVLTYASRRRLPHRGLTSSLSIRIGDPIEPTQLETWLTAQTLHPRRFRHHRARHRSERGRFL